MQGASFFRALPAYFGGKRRLAPLIFALLEESLPRSEWSHSLFLDPLCGGGSAALYAKGQGFHVVASDLAERAAVVARALIANSSIRLTELEVLHLFERPAEPYAQVALSHSPSIFTAAEAEWLDRALAQAMGMPEPKRSLLLLLIMKLALRCQPMSMLRGTDARAAATADYDRVSSRRVGHYLKARDLFTPSGVWAVAKEVNAGVFGGHGQALKADALHLTNRTQASVVYLDPPYAGTTRYEREYRVLDELLGDDLNAGASPSLDELLAASAHIPTLVLSYGGPTKSLQELTAQVSKYRRVQRAVSIPYVHLKSIARRNVDERLEHLILAER